MMKSAESSKNKSGPLNVLTMDITRATLPNVSFFVAEPVMPREPDGLSSFVGQEAVSVALATSSVSPSLYSDFRDTGSLPVPHFHPALPPINPSVSTSSRTRYVLPPGFSTSNECTVPVPDVITAPTGSSTNIYVTESVQPPHMTEFGDQSVSTCAPLPDAHVHSVLASYDPVIPVWFYATIVNGSKIWWPFSRCDSYRLEDEFSKKSSNQSPTLVSSMDELSLSHVDDGVPVEGGRYDVFISHRERHAVYWDEPVTEVRRATWFYRSPDENRVLPFSERLCDLLEARYRLTLECSLWGQRFELPSDDARGGNDYFIFHSSHSMIQYRAWPITVNRWDQHDGFATQSSADEPFMKAFSTAPNAEQDKRICYLRRGLDEPLLAQLDEGEFRPVDHVYFVVHGIGTIYNLKGQGLVECVNGLRRTARQIADDHFARHNGRAEFLPIMWHDALHSDATGVDEQLGRLTLRSIPKLRQFTNGTLMDILFYTSSKYCQIILDTVARGICRLRDLFLSRNPQYTGGFSIVGHSLGAVIVFDLLAHQRLDAESLVKCDEHLFTTSTSEIEVELHGEDCAPISHLATTRTEREETECKSDHSSGSNGETESWSLVGGNADTSDFDLVHSNNTVPKILLNDITTSTSLIPDTMKLTDILSKAGLNEGQVRQVLASLSRDTTPVLCDNDRSTEQQTDCERETDHSTFTGFGTPVVIYPQLGFSVTAFFMLGSPLGLFLTARGIHQLSADYRLPSCSLMFNIFHPFDPVAYRLETLIEPMFQPRAVLMPHHKGRKRLHLQLRDNLARVGADLKAKFLHSVQATWRTLQDFAVSHRLLGPSTTWTTQDQGDPLEEKGSEFTHALSQQFSSSPGDRDDAGSCTSETETSFNSQLNQGRRLDYVLQEAPLESFSDYLFALGSHAAYWESKDTALFLLSEVYSAQSIFPVFSVTTKTAESAPTNSAISTLHLSVASLSDQQSQPTDIQSTIRLPSELTVACQTSAHTNTAVTTICAPPQNATSTLTMPLVRDAHLPTPLLHTDLPTGVASTSNQGLDVPLPPSLGQLYSHQRLTQVPSDIPVYPHRRSQAPVYRPPAFQHLFQPAAAPDLHATTLPFGHYQPSEFSLLSASTASRSSVMSDCSLPFVSSVAANTHASTDRPFPTPIVSSTTGGDQPPISSSFIYPTS